MTARRIEVTAAPKEARNRQMPSTVAVLRSLMPDRQLSFTEAKTVAELQANRMLKLSGSTSAPFAEEIITQLPRIEVRRSNTLIGSGATAWSRGRWQVRLNAAEPFTRQRFTLAHEFKHILDAASEDVIYRHLPAGPARERHIEAICDHFAACLLMPKAQVKQLWGQGVQEIAHLAWRFEVSQQAMLIRLQVLGLVDPMPRCITTHRVGSVAVRGSNRRPQRQGYHRPSLPAVPRFPRSSFTRHTGLQFTPLTLGGAPS